MGSMVVKIDRQTVGKLKNRRFYSDIDVLNFKVRRMKTGVEDELKDSFDLPMVYDVDAVKVAVRNILTWRVGESILRPEFGHELKKSMYSQLNQYNTETVCQEIKRALEVNEPRINIVSVDVKQDEDESDANESRLMVRVVYEIKGDKTEDSKIVEETTITGK